jgi:hypothetical protein
MPKKTFKKLLLPPRIKIKSFKVWEKSTKPLLLQLLLLLLLLLMLLLLLLLLLLLMLLMLLLLLSKQLVRQRAD